MENNILMQMLKNYATSDVDIIDIHVGMVCNKCGHHWGVKIELGRDLLNQADRFVCMNCHNTKIKETIGMYEVKNITKEKRS